MWDAAWVEQIVAGRQDDIADLDGDEFIFLVEVDRIGGAEFLTGFAGAFLEVSAVFTIDHRVIGYSLWEGGIDGFPIAQSGFEDIIDDFLGAFLLADTAARAQIGVDIAGFLA